VYIIILDSPRTIERRKMTKDKPTKIDTKYVAKATKELEDKVAQELAIDDTKETKASAEAMFQGGEPFGGEYNPPHTICGKDFKDCKGCE